MPESYGRSYLGLYEIKLVFKRIPHHISRGCFRKRNRLIPVRVLPCKPEGLLKTRIYIDLVGIKEAEKVKEVLLLKIKGSIKKRLKPEKEPLLPAQSKQNSLIAFKVVLRGFVSFFPNRKK